MMRLLLCGLAILLSQAAASSIGGGSSTPGVEGAVRLVGGERTDTSYSGRIEIYHAGEWGTICDDGVNKEDALITCRGLGYGDGELWDAPAGTGEIWMDSIDCEEHHNALVECDQQGWGSHDCSHSEDTGVICVDPIEPVHVDVDPIEGEVKLVDGEKTETTWSGRVEIFHDGKWGTVCDDGVNGEDAEIICRGLGYPEGELMVSPPAAEGGDIWMDQIDCDDHHDALAECDQNGWGEHDCSHSEDIGVVCTGGQGGGQVNTNFGSDSEGDVRLVGSSPTANSWSGRVEIYHAGEWGTVCDDDVNDEDAEITCQGLGYTSGVVNYAQTAGSGPIWMDQIDCDYPHSQLSECTHNGWGENDCSHSEDFAVTCSNL